MADNLITNSSTKDYTKHTATCLALLWARCLTAAAERCASSPLLCLLKHHSIRRYHCTIIQRGPILVSSFLTSGVDFQYDVMTVSVSSSISPPPTPDEQQINQERIQLFGAALIFTERT